MPIKQSKIIRQKIYTTIEEITDKPGKYHRAGHLLKRHHKLRSDDGKRRNDKRKKGQKAYENGN